MVRSRSAGSLVGGLVLIGMGMFYLAGQFLGQDLLAQVWPLFVLGASGLFFLGMALGGPEAARLAVPGCVLGTVGLILLLQNTFDRWESWSYAWTLILVAVGMGLYISGWRGHDEQSRQRGVRIALLGFTLFLVFGVFFELVLGLSNFGVTAQVAWASGLIVLGLFLVARSSSLFGRAH